MLVRHLDVRCESVLDPRLKCFCPSLKFTVWCWSQSAAETNIESSGGTFYVIWYFWNVSSRESRVIVFQYEPPDSWTVADPGPGPGQGAACHRNHKYNAETWEGDAFIISYHPTEMLRCTGWVEVTPLSGPGTETEKCAAMWQEVEKVERRIVEMVEAWRRRAWGGSQREHNPSR